MRRLRPALANLFGGRTRRSVIALVAATLMVPLLATAAVAATQQPALGSAKVDKLIIKVTPRNTHPATPTTGGGISDSQLLRKRPAHAHALSAATPLTGQDDMTVDECRAHPSAFSGAGYGKSRFISCQAATITLTHEVCDLFGCDILGVGTFDMTDLQHGNNGSRFVDIVQVLGNWHLSGDIGSTTLTSQMQCAAAATGPCLPDGVFGGPYTATVAEWAAGGAFASNFFEFSQPDSSGTGPDLVSFADLNWGFTLTAPGAPPASASGPPSRFRCDAAPYIVSTAAGPGCVFAWVTETLHYSLTGPAAQAASHIWVAQNFPGVTLPPKANKAIPGAPGTSPLHRTTDQQLIDAHRATARTTCNRYFPGYARMGLQCDEYPFARTLEGADSATDNYSASPILARDNQSAGGSLGNFYSFRRLLGDSIFNDPFFVQIDP